MSTPFTRRRFLQVTGAGALGALLGACQPQIVEVEKIVKETVVVETEKVVKEAVEVEKEVTRIVEKEAQPAGPTEKVVRVLIDSWAVGEIPFDATAREYSDAHDDISVQIQTTFEGWNTKVIAQINAGTLQWSAAGILSTDYHTAKWVRTGLVQPMQDYLSASQQEGADTLLSDMIPTVREAGYFEGNLYGIPYSFENVTFNWRTDYFDAIGLSEPPGSWQEWVEVGRELKKWGAAENIYATSFVDDMTTTCMGLLCAKSTKPYTDEGLVDWLGEDMLEVLRFYRKMVLEEELTPPHGYDGWLDAFYSGKVASVHAQSSRGVWGQNAFGTDKCTTSPIVPYEAGAGSGAPYWGNDMAILNKAPYPQEAMDYLVYTMGPQNIGFQKTVIRTGKTPVYKSIYDSVIKGDPQFRVYEWMIGMREDVEKAIPLPQTTWVDIQYSAYGKYIVSFTEPGSSMTAEECAQSIYDDVQTEVAKQKVK